MFTHLKDLIQTKAPLKQNMELDADFNPYMAQRWLSMYNKDFATIINYTTNSSYPALVDKNMWYKLLQTCIPCNPNRYIKYIKKNKKEKTINDNVLSFVSANMEISKREALELLTQDKSLLKNVKKSLGEK